MAAQRITDQNIAALITLDSALDQAIFRGDAPMYLRLNYQFHHQLYQLARAPILSALTDGLWLRFGPSLRIVCGRLGTLHLVDQHKETLLALKAGDGRRPRMRFYKMFCRGWSKFASALRKGRRW